MQLFIFIYLFRNQVYYFKSGLRILCFFDLYVKSRAWYRNKHKMVVFPAFVLPNYCLTDVYAYFNNLWHLNYFNGILLYLSPVFKNRKNY